MTPMPIHLKLSFDHSEIEHWASRYAYKTDSKIESEVAPRVKAQGFFELGDFLTLCRWKAPRAERHYVQNADSDIRAVTALSLAINDERLKICLLMALNGVNWPMASVLLHFGAQDRYPILDWRALESLGMPKLNCYTFDIWWTYTQFCRRLADEAGVKMRTLDRALWQYSKEHPKSQQHGGRGLLGVSES